MKKATKIVIALTIVGAIIRAMNKKEEYVPVIIGSHKFIPVDGGTCFIFEP